MAGFRGARALRGAGAAAPAARTRQRQEPFRLERRSRFAQDRTAARRSDARCAQAGDGQWRSAREEIALKQLALGDLRVDLIARSVELGRATHAARGGGAARWAGPLESGGARARATRPFARHRRPLRPHICACTGLVVEAEGPADRRRARARPTALPPAVRPRCRCSSTPARCACVCRIWHGPRSVARRPHAFSSAFAASGAAASSAAASTGSVDFNGRLAPDPLLASGRLRIERFPLHAFMPYVADRLPLAVLRAEAQWSGELEARQGDRGLGREGQRRCAPAEVRVHTKADTSSGAGDELLSWQSFALDGIRVAVEPQATPQIEVREAALNDFFARLVVTEQGRLNLNSHASAAADAPAMQASAPAAPASAASAPRAAGRRSPWRWAASSSTTAASISATASSARTTAPTSPN
ncbi:DUF748 domain-containing protein [Piscinibacter aquaticus]|uniref:DUF748 domain-containing protein n=1 Tax=Piscinibacter aquaticus TaxID=392597 RepID=A0A5C6U3U1_9BURK|nr:DUF748 domain-containing protein [Piscinibacter aquaticus]